MLVRINYYYYFKVVVWNCRALRKGGGERERGVGGAFLCLYNGVCLFSVCIMCLQVWFYSTLLVVMLSSVR